MTLSPGTKKAVAMETPWDADLTTSDIQTRRDTSPSLPACPKSSLDQRPAFKTEFVAFYGLGRHLRVECMYAGRQEKPTETEKLQPTSEREQSHADMNVAAA